MTGPFRTMADIRRADREAGRYFFEPATMRFFDSRVEAGPIGGRFFITSEQCHHSDGTSDTRKFSVRRANDDGSIDTVGEFQGYPSKSAARSAALRLSKEAEAEDFIREHVKVIPVTAPQAVSS